MTPGNNRLYRIGEISTHTPLAGRDVLVLGVVTISFTFLLTRPLRDVTMHYREMNERREISTHTPLAGRDGQDDVLVYE